MLRRIALMIVIALAGLGPVGGARAAEPAAPASSAPAGGVVGTGLDTCDEAALDAALVGGGDVTFNCGGPATILILDEKTITQSTTIYGGGIITLTAGLVTRLFYVNNGASLALHDIVLDSGYKAGESGGAIANAGTLLLDHTLIQYSQADLNHGGGAIFTNGPVSIVDSQFSHNRAGVGGAMLAQAGNAHVVIRTSTFDYNFALQTAAPGGAILVNPNAEVKVYQSTFHSNTSPGDGGAVYNKGTFASESSSYTYNTTTENPSASFRGYGGAIASVGNLTLLGDILFQNRSRYGGGLYVGGTASPASAQLSDVQFVGNQAVFSGGGLYTSAANTSLSVIESIFQGNHADVGGGLSRTDTPLTITRSAIGENVATQGGGLVGTGSLASEVRVYDSTFYSNVVTGTQGGAIFNNALMDLRNLTLEGNTSGVFNSGSFVVMKMANTVLHSVSLNCDGDGTKPTSQGGNFSTDGSCSLALGTDAQGISLDPLFGELEISFQIYVTKFFRPLPGSPLINTAAVACSKFDQRRAVRPNACDRGAIEAGGLEPRLFLPFIRHSP